MKIAIASHGFAVWGGGIDFVRHIASSVAAASEDHPNLKKLLILPGDDFAVKYKNALYPIREIVRQLFNAEAPTWIMRPHFSESYFRKTFSDLEGNFEVFYSGSTLKSQALAAKNLSADIMFPCIGVLDAQISLPWIGYIYDFQHRYIPDFFTAQEIQSRNNNFERMLNSASHVIVNAKTVVDDALKFHRNFSAKVHALPFSPCPQKIWLENTLDVREHYGINQPYFMICNQFWKHKDHATAFRAFARYVQGGGSASLVCTGQTSDYRFPDYFGKLVHLLSELEILPLVKILGHISKEHQISLLKNALAIVQPTLFEGGPGGGASYDAISLGVPVIASDIPVNREMDCGDITYFHVGNDKSLAEALHAQGSKIYIRPNSVSLWEQGIKRRKQCGQFILNVAKQAVIG